MYVPAAQRSRPGSSVSIMLANPDPPVKHRAAPMFRSGLAPPPGCPARALIGGAGKEPLQGI